MSDTPRTDAAQREVDVAFVSFDGLVSEPQMFVDPDFARKLEREIADLQKYYDILLEDRSVLQLDFDKERMSKNAMRAVLEKWIDEYNRSSQELSEIGHTDFCPTVSMVTQARAVLAEMP